MKIRNVLMKRIWRIPLFLLIVFMLGVSVVAVAVIYSPKVPPSPLIILGFGFNDVHCVHGENLEAEWAAQMLRLSSNGSFALDLRFDYISENPTQGIYYSHDYMSTPEIDFEFVASVALMQIESLYKVGPSWRDVHYDTITGIIPTIQRFSDSRSFHIEYKGKFSPEVNLTKTMTKAYALMINLSWIRVFKDKNDGTFYYQWLRGSSLTEADKKLVVDVTYYDVQGKFLVYYPIPENVTAPLLPAEFDYVRWIKENI